jgi:hypothetical protein
MTDTVEVRTALGPVSPVADVAAKAYLRRLMVQRNGTIRRRAEQG